MNRWFMFAVICLVTALDFGIIFTLGAMFVAMVETFQADRSSTATVQSLLVGISLSFSVVSGALITKFGIRVVTLVSSILVPFGFCISFVVKEIHYLYLTISVISGIGISLIHVIGIVVIQHVFPQSLHPLCFALHGTGVNLAGIVYPLLIERLLHEYGVHGSFLILGGLFMNTFGVYLLLRDPNVHTEGNNEDVNIVEDFGEVENGELTEVTESLKKVKDDCGTQTVGAESVTPSDEEDKEEKTEECEAVILKSNKVKECCGKIRSSSLLTKQYIFLLTASALCIPALNAFIGLVVDIFVWKGFSVSQGLLSFVPFNIFSLLSKFIPVLAKKLFKRISCFTLPVAYCVCGLLGQLLVCFTNSYTVMLIGTSLTGLSLGGVFPAMLIAGAKIATTGEWPVASGLLMTIIGILSSGHGPLFGTIRDRTGSYTGPILIISILQAAGALLYLFGLISRRYALREHASIHHGEVKIQEVEIS